MDSEASLNTLTLRTTYQDPCKRMMNAKGGVQWTEARSPDKEAVGGQWRGAMGAVTVNGVHLEYRLEGASRGETLALAHSLGTDLTLWDGVAEILGRERRILRWDLRGHGGSGAPAGEYRLAEFAAEAVALFDSLGVRRAHFAGVSLGGMIGMQLALQAPERIGKLILSNTAARIGARQGWEDRIRLALEGGMAAVAEGVAERWFTAGYRGAHPESVARVVGLLTSTSRQGYAASCAAIRDADLTNDLRRIQTPALIVAGTEDPTTTPQDGRMLERGIAGARYRELPGAHLTPVELPEEFSAAVRDFLAGEAA